MDLPHNGTATSAAAAESMRSSAATIAQRIHDFLLTRGEAGATADQIEQALGLSGNTVRPRLVEMREDGRVVDSRLIRRTRAGRAAKVWQARRIAR
jgi:predicted ArsR family transcriptional regulator